MTLPTEKEIQHSPGVAKLEAIPRSWPQFAAVITQACCRPCDLENVYSSPSNCAYPKRTPLCGVCWPVGANFDGGDDEQQQQQQGRFE